MLMTRRSRPRIAPSPALEDVDHYRIVKLDVGGANEKDVLEDPDDGAIYIAKLGRRNSDLEVITEYAIHLIGKSIGARVADARIARYGGRLRYLSRYFLDPEQADELIHGMQLFTELLDEQVMSGVTNDPAREQEMFTVQTVKDAFGAHYGSSAEEQIFNGFVAMLTHDALIGVQDRHHENWGIVVNRRGGSPVFAPLFDSARGLFCNQLDEHLRRYVCDDAGKQKLDKFIQRSTPLIGFKGVAPYSGQRLITHAQLLSAVFKNYREQRPRIASMLNRYDWPFVHAELNSKIGHLCSPFRINLILTCLRRRLKVVWKAINDQLC